MNPKTHTPGEALIRAAALGLCAVACQPQPALVIDPQPSRCTAGSESCPLIDILEPVEAAVFAPGATVNFEVTVWSARDIASVSAIVTGGIRFRFPTMTPNDTTFAAVFPVRTAGAQSDTVRLVVSASDFMGNQATATRTILIQ